MKISIKNLGPIKNAEFEISDFTAITGFNNTGKTYISYALYGFLKTWSTNTKNLELDEEINSFIENGSLTIKLSKFKKKVLGNFSQLTKNYSENIHNIFSANEEEYKQTEFNIRLNQNDILLKNTINSDISIKGKKILSVNKDQESEDLNFKINLESNTKLPPKYILSEIVSEYINEALLNEILPTPYIITSERTGINIFQNELDINKNVFFEKLAQSKTGKFDLNPFEYIDEVFNRYSIPIKDGIDRTRDIEKDFKQNSYISKEYPAIVKKLENSTGVGYKNNKGQYFITYKEGRKKIALPVYLGSSSSRALFDLYLFIKHTAKKGQLLIIDEPELNLHPKIQIQIARLLASLSNIGVKVMITSHSDYIVKEINNLIMLSSDFENKASFKKSHKYLEYEFLKNINFYITENSTLSHIETDKFGLLRTTFDDSIREMQNISDELYENLL
ncbi:hypothetical protein CJ739_4022 [Mariniflexile rhizosphaerae]|uniref:AAA family ATPase n=1 Tax=unclassified Mariniflexile TaxID=2643887 RepID=UPI000CCA612F|nr:ATP-binding protein [Mariniflexile sp. TRM1-10]AXP83080.1 hypothetical protein CJ739_4022 [Mariniflexile sp. TRM1-10]PLB19755.1 MAG: AAA_21 domain containing protein [Flavobacteriaceae bacterium FS1-H7996/R]